MDDGERLAAATKEYLQTQGFAVRVATRGDTAVDVITSEPPDLAVLDLMLDEDVEQVVGLEHRGRRPGRTSGDYENVIDWCGGRWI